MASVRVGVAGLLVGLSVQGGGALAQEAPSTIALPEITVSSPSPVAGTASGTGGGAQQVGQLAVPTDTFAPVTIISRDEIDRNQYQTLGDATFTKPGVTSTTYAPGASRPVIRGLDSFRVRIQENGLNAFDVSNLGEDHAVPIDPMSANRIEIIRGPATLRYGSQAIGGVVSATNDRIPEVVPDGMTGRLTGGVNSVNRGYSTSGQAQGGADNVAVHADFFNQRSGDYATPQGTQANSAVNSGGAAIGGSVITDSGFVGLSYSHFDSLYQVPGGESAASRTRLDIVQDKVMAKGEYRPPSEYIQAIRFWAGASNYRHDEIGIGDDGDDGIQATFKNQEQELRVEVQHMPVATALGVLNGAVGVQLGHQSLGTAGEAGGLLAPTRTRTGALYAFEELALTNTLKLQAAGRIEYASLRGSPGIFPSDYLPTGDEDPLQTTHRHRGFAPKSLSVGLSQVLPWWNIVATLNAQYVERAPSASELYSKGPHDAPGTFEIGDPNLGIERARSIEFSLKKGDGPVRFEASVYYTKFAGFIYKRLTGVMCGEDFASCGVDDELQQVVYSQQNATFKGAEFIGQADLLPVGPGVVGLEAQYDIVDARFADGTYVPRLPPQRVGGGIYFRSDEWFAKVGLLHAFAQNDVAPYETRTPGYNLLKAEINYTRKLASNQLGLTEVSLGIVGDNLLNDDIRNSVSFKKDEVLLPGRGVKAFASVKF